MKAKSKFCWNHNIHSLHFKTAYPT